MKTKQKGKRQKEKKKKEKRTEGIRLKDAFVVAFSEETPQILQRQIVMRLLTAFASFVIWIILLAIHAGWMACSIFLLIPVAFTVLTILLMLQCGQKRYIAMVGSCIGVQYALFSRKHHVKSFTLRTDRESFKVLCKNQRITDIAEGDPVTLYLANESQIQKMNGGAVIASYLALERAQSC